MLKIPKPSIDKLQQGRDVTFTAEKCEIDTEGYWIDDKELQVMSPDGKVWVPRKTHVVDLVVKLIKNKGRGRIRR
jgi:hypothetical protein